jgi:serine/threonine protein kinase
MHEDFLYDVSHLKFETQAEIMKRVSNVSNMVHYEGHGCAEDNNAFWIIMEELDGGHLEHSLEDRDVYSEAAVLQVCLNCFELGFHFVLLKSCNDHCCFHR